MYDDVLDIKDFNIYGAIQQYNKSKTTFQKMVDFLESTYQLKSELVPCLVGAPGIGKTAAVYEHAAKVGANVVTIIASQVLPSEVSGLTMPDKDTKSMEIYDHYKLSSLKDGDILFFDELLEADQSVLSACLTLIESRMMMSGRLLPDIQIVAATNPTISAVSLRENIRQRFLFKQFNIDIDGTIEYIKKTTGFSLPHNDICALIEDTSDEYNILTPRSLSKMAKWIAIADQKYVKDILVMISQMWSERLAMVLHKAWINKFNNDTKNKAKQYLYDLAKEKVTSLEELDCYESVETIVNLLKEQGYWDEVAKQLGGKQCCEE